MPGTMDVGLGGLSQARLSRVGGVLERAIEGQSIAGAVALIHRRDQEAYAVALGWQDLERGIAMQRDSIFRIASMTKPTIAVAALSLVEEGRIRLYDPIDTWLPELAQRQVLRTPNSALDDVVPAARAITLHDILTFRLGIGWGPSSLRDRYLALMAPPLSLANNLPASGVLDPDAFMARLSEWPLAYQPGARWLYHTAADILGVLIARVAGKPLETVLRERIFEPLAMVDTSFSVPKEKRARLAVLYAPAEDGKGKLQIRDGASDTLWADAPVFPSGGGGLCSTADDFQRFSRMLLGQGELEGERVLSRKSVEAMSHDWLTAEQHQTPFSRFDAYDLDDAQIWGHRGFGYCLSVRTERISLGPEVGALTWPGAFGTTWIADRAESLSMTFLTQVISKNPYYSRLGEDVLTMAYQAIAD